MLLFYRLSLAAALVFGLQLTAPAADRQGVPGRRVGGGTRLHLEWVANNF